MNERIVLLKHQASVWCDENIPDQYSEETNGYGRAWEEKFYELIVKECMNVLAESREVRQTAYYYRNRIAKHFGVEE